MRIIRLKCSICSSWFRPVAPLSPSCPACGAMPIQVSSHPTYKHYRLLDSANRMIEIVSAVPRHRFSPALVTRMAQVLVDGVENPMPRLIGIRQRH